MEWTPKKSPISSLIIPKNAKNLAFFWKKMFFYTKKAHIYTRNKTKKTITDDHLQEKKSQKKTATNDRWKVVPKMKR